MLKTEIEKSDCCGCGACYQICAAKALSMRRDIDGFEYPVLDRERCSDCGRCKTVCPINPTALKRLKFLRADNALAAVHKDAEILRRSSSGGAFSAVVGAVEEKSPCRIFGAEARGLFKIRHRYVSSASETAVFAKSKYIPSCTMRTFSEAKAFLEKGETVVYSGTPCQIAALKLFVGGRLSEKLFTIDFSCHGVGSPYSLKKYFSGVEARFGRKIKKFDFRTKSRHLMAYSSQSSRIVFNDGSGRIRFRDPWFKGFVAALYKRPSCAECPFSRPERISDITLADFWGIERISKNLDSGKGVSLILANTEKGRSILPQMEKTAHIESFPFGECAKYNIPLREKVVPHPQSVKFRKLLKKGYSFEYALEKVLGRPTCLMRAVSLFMDCLPVRVGHSVARRTKIFTGKVKNLILSVLSDRSSSIILDKWARLNGRPHRPCGKGGRGK